MLADGKPVMRQTVADGGKGGRALAVQDVAASPDVVWDRILSFNDYPKMVPNVKECKVYESTKKGGQRIIKISMKIGAMGVALEYFISHTYDPRLSVMTWTLDYTRLSDLIDSVGFWGIEPHPTKPGWSRVFYSVDAAFPAWVPGFVVSALTKKALTDATSWVKTESEKVQLARGGLVSATPTNAKQCKAAGGKWRKGSCVLPQAKAGEGETSGSERSLEWRLVLGAALIFVAGFITGRLSGDVLKQKES